MPTLVQNLMDRWSVMQGGKGLHAFDWGDIVDLMAPMLGQGAGFAPGRSRMRRMFDATAMTDGIKLSSYLKGNITNQAIDWHQMQIEAEELHNDQETQGWLAVVNKRLLSVYNASNFYTSWHTFFLNHPMLGTAAMYIDNAQANYHGGEPGTMFTPLSHGSYGIEEDADSRIRTLFRQFSYTATQAVQVFNGNVSSKVKEYAREARTMDTRVQFVHACYPRIDWKQGSRMSKDFPFACVYFEHDTQHKNEESGYHEFPYAVARWERMADTPWGFGLGHMALPYTRTLNRMTELQIQMLALQIQPAFKQVHQGVLGRVSFEPLAINVVRRPDDLTVLDINARPDLVQISQQDMRQSLHDIFMISGLESVPAPDQGAQTAYEVAQRIAINARLMGPAFHRLAVEALTPAVDRVFALEWRKGRIPMPPMQVFEAAKRRQGRIDVEFLGPLARAQKGTDVQAILQVYAVAAQMVQAKSLVAGVPGPNVFDILDEDVAITRAAEAGSVPRELVRDALAVARMRAARAAVEQQAAQGQQMEQGSQTLKNLAPMLQTMGDMRRAA